MKKVSTATAASEEMAKNEQQKKGWKLAMKNYRQLNGTFSLLTCMIGNRRWENFISHKNWLIRWKFHCSLFIGKLLLLWWGGVLSFFLFIIYATPNSSTKKFNRDDVSAWQESVMHLKRNDQTCHQKLLKDCLDKRLGLEFGVEESFQCNAMT